MPLKSTAKKEEQIAFINKLEASIEALIDFASGNESALDKLLSTTASTHQEPQVLQFAPALGDPSKVPADVACQCPVAVKDKNSLTQLCLLCNKNAYANHYVFAHTDAGRALLAGDVAAFQAAAYPETGVQPSEATFISADNIVFMETDEHDEDY